jgi:serine/threonine protein kinase
MPSESVAGFLDRAQASRVLFPEQVEQLIRQPDIPQSGLEALCEYLLSRGVLSRFQADALRAGRGGELSYAGYPVIDDLGPIPGGRAYRALHPSLRTPLVLRRLRADALAPADTLAAFVGRARAFGMMPHPGLVHLLDIGAVGDEVYAVVEAPADAADLDALSREIGGAMPGFLAAEYGAGVAAALRAAHERGGAHGDVRPANLLVGPLTVKVGPDGRERRRPAPDAHVRLAELGLVPVRPPAATDPGAVHPYLAPERLDAGTPAPAGDVYGLGATLYFLLTGRPPFPADDLDLADRVRRADPPPLAGLRPDIPADFAALVGRMLQKHPDRRPATMSDVEAELAAFCRPGTVRLRPAPVQPVAYAAHPAAEAAPVPAEPVEDWGVSDDPFAAAQASAPAAPRRREISAKEKGKYRMMLLLGGLLHLTGVTLLVLWLTGTFDGSPTPPEEPTKPAKAKDDQKKPPRKSQP